MNYLSQITSQSSIKHNFSLFVSKFNLNISSNIQISGGHLGFASVVEVISVMYCQKLIP